MESIEGKIYALLAALAWAVSVLLFRLCGRETSPLALNFFKNVVALVLFVLTSFFFGGTSLLLDIPSRDLWILFASGFVGLTAADTLFFACLNRLGASRTAIVDCLYSPSVVFFSWILLGETLSAMDAFGGGLIVSSILMIEKSEDRKASTQRDLLVGSLFGVGAMACMGVGIVVIKGQLESYHLITCASWRLAGGVATLALLSLFVKNRNEMWRTLVPGPAWKKLLPTGVVGAYVVLFLWLAGMKYTQTNLSAILNQTSTLFIVVLAAAFLKEPLTKRRGVAVLMAFSGSLLVLWD